MRALSCSISECLPCFVFTLQQDSRVPGLYNLYFFFTSSRSTVLKKGGYCTYRIITSVRVFISIIVRRRELIIVAWIKKEGRKEGRMDECMEGRKEGRKGGWKEGRKEGRKAQEDFSMS